VPVSKQFELSHPFGEQLYLMAPQVYYFVLKSLDLLVCAKTAKSGNPGFSSGELAAAG